MQPKASSTPVVRRPSGRPSIHNSDIGSPIQLPDNNYNPLETNDYGSEDGIIEESGSGNELSGDDKETGISEEDKDSRNSDINNSKSPLVFIGSLAVVVIASIIGQLFFSEGIATPVNDICDEFPQQTSDFCLSINTAINEINRSNKPQSVLLIYENTHSVEKMLEKIAEYAVCHITSCQAKPIVLKSNYFNTLQVLSDYGTVIEDNRERLTKSGVMVVHNLEKITGKTAEAFHSLCDEVSPVVEKALFLFTMAADKVPSEKEAIGYVEKRLKVLWNDMKSDNFQPLITRMTSFVLPVNRF